MEEIKKFINQRQNWLKSRTAPIIIEYAVKVTTSLGNFSLEKYGLIHIVMAVNNFLFSIQASITSFFLEGVKSWLDEREVRYIWDTVSIDESGYTYKFNYVILRSLFAYKICLQANNRSSKYLAESVAFLWMATRDQRDDNSASLAVIIDSKRLVHSKLKDLLINCEIVPTKWSAQTRAINSLAA